MGKDVQRAACSPDDRELGHGRMGRHVQWVDGKRAAAVPA